jgi:hypothetical protein
MMMLATYGIPVVYMLDIKWETELRRRNPLSDGPVGRRGRNPLSLFHGPCYHPGWGSHPRWLPGYYSHLSRIYSIGTAGKLSWLEVSTESI